ncbi:MAG: Uma2 family endonuclease [Vulcanimicrobiaceae bacterium]
MRRVAAGRPLSDEFVFEISQAIPEYAFEREPSGELTVAPNHTDGGAKSGAGGRVFDSSAGFSLSTAGLRAPDASWLSPERLSALTPAQRTGYWRACPSVAIEVRSPSEPWAAACRKIDEYAAAGADYAIAIDPAAGITYERGNAPAGLALDVAAIADA